MSKTNTNNEYQCLLDDYADLQIKHDRMLIYCKLLEESLEVKERLLNYIRRENEELNNKLEVYKNANNRRDVK